MAKLLDYRRDRDAFRQKAEELLGAIDQALDGTGRLSDQDLKHARAFVRDAVRARSRYGELKLALLHAAHALWEPKVKRREREALRRLGFLPRAGKQKSIYPPSPVLELMYMRLTCKPIPTGLLGSSPDTARLPLVWASHAILNGMKATREGTVLVKGLPLLEREALSVLRVLCGSSSDYAVRERLLEYRREAKKAVQAGTASPNIMAASNISLPTPMDEASGWDMWDYDKVDQHLEYDDDTGWDSPPPPKKN